MSTIYEKMTAVADAIREKTGGTEPLTLDDMAVEIAGISTGVELNFDVVGGTTEPTNPTENMIWVNTDVEIPYFEFSATEPENPIENMIWIVTGTSSDLTFNAIPENTLYVYPLFVRQYINNAWSTSISTSIYRNGQWISINSIPEFTYTGNYQIVNDNDAVITRSNDNWKIRFLTSGTLTFTALNGAGDGIDVFCVGGGGNGGIGSPSTSNGGGGGGGYTKTQKGVQITPNVAYQITIGGSGGQTSAFNVTANGGSNGAKGEGPSTGGKGGDGGSGGGGGTGSPGSGGSDGSNGGGSKGGTGQGTTTREFGETTGKLYAGGGSGGNGGSISGIAGGAGGGGNQNSDGAANTGGGGGGKWYQASQQIGYGGSGIVVIRNKRG